MIFDNAYKNAEEALTQSMEFLNFVKKREAIEKEYSNALGKLYKEFQQVMDTSNHGNMSKTHTSTTKAKKKRLSVLDTIGRSRSSAQWAAEFEGLEQNETPSFLKSTLGCGVISVVEDTLALGNEHSKIARRLSVSIVEPLTMYLKTFEETVKTYSDEAAKITKSRESETGKKKLADSWKSTPSNDQDVSKLLQAIYNSEEQRANLMKTYLFHYHLIRSDSIIEYSEYLSPLTDKLEQIDIAEDMQEFIQEPEAKKKITDALKQGYLEKRSKDQQTWKKRYFVFKAEQKKIYYFENDTSLKIKGVIDLSKSQIYSLDENYFSKKSLPSVQGSTKKRGDSNPKRTSISQLSLAPPTSNTTSQYYFQIVTRNNSDQDIVYFSSNSKEDRNEWLTILSQYVNCCDVCSILSSSPYARFIVDPARYRKIKSIKISIQNAKDIYSIALVQGKLDLYCVIVFNGIEMAKTQTKYNTGSPVWGETFLFDQVLHTTNSVALEVYSKSNVLGMKKDSLIGKVYFNLDISGENFNRQGPFSLIPSSDSNSSIESTSTLNGSIEVRDEAILPSCEYEDMLNYLTNDLECIQSLSDYFTEREELATRIMNIFEGSGGIPNIIYFLASMADLEIQKTDDPRILFRSSSLTAKCLTNFMKRCGTSYLIKTLKKPILDVLNQKESCEVDPLKVEEENISANAERLLVHISSFWNAIIGSPYSIPKEFREIFHQIQLSVETKKYEDELAKYRAVSGFLFLRFFVPAITNPVSSGIVEEQIDPAHTRTLMLIARALQTLGNFVKFTKEPAFQFLDEYAEKNVESLKSFIDGISQDDSIGLPYAIQEKIDLPRELASLQRLILKQRANKQSKDKDPPKVLELLEIFNRLDEKTQKYEQDIEDTLDKRKSRLSHDF